MINELIAKHVMKEEKPIDFPVLWEISFSQYLDGDPILSQGKNWYIGHRYEDNDVQAWYPMPFDSDMNEAMRVVRAIQSMTPKIDHQLWWNFVNALDETSGYHLWDLTAEKICRAALNAVGILA